MDEGWGLPAGAGVGATTLPVKDKPVFGGVIFAAGVGGGLVGVLHVRGTAQASRGKKQAPLNTAAQCQKSP
ncbi:hypothetical protein GCM10023310_60370 [Paenibacillus vulneris]|uniref:Uncharacterized protein n=1 Tax=Paenibacillus vulneris TaxID=1133364 RepID=A0ABW3URA0_9BACL